MADLLHLLRVTIEALSPVSSASGEAGLYDVVLSRDANGLPEIAGSSLQGVLRHLYEEPFGLDATDKLFGYAEEEGDGGATGRLFFGFGKVHGSDDVAIAGLHPEAPQFADGLLRVLAADAPLHRDHVALDHRHTPAGRAKFERAAVPKGTRFSFEIAMWGKSEEAGRDEERLIGLLALVREPAFRLGGAARRGYGKVKLLRAGHAALPISDPARIRETREGPPSDLDGFADVMERLEQPSGTGVVTMELRLTPVGLWRVGSTGAALRTGEDELRNGDGLIDEGRRGPDLRDKDVDAAPVSEPWIEWTPAASGRDAGAWKESGSQNSKEDANSITFTIAGTSIKGPLAHRTVFHWNRLATGAARMIDPGDWETEKDDGERKKKISEWMRKIDKLKLDRRADELEVLFGTAKEKRERNASRGRAARLIIEDAEVAVDRDNAVGALDHNSIDRFTGGVRNRFLFFEEVVIGGEINVSMTILPPLDGEGGSGTWPAGLRKAFCHALRDLVEGRLALGAKSLGFCAGEEPKFGGDENEAAAWNSAWRETARGQGEGRGT